MREDDESTVSLDARHWRTLAFNSLFFSLRLKLTTTTTALTTTSTTSYWSLHLSALSEQVRPPLSLSFSSLLSLCLPSTKTTTTTTTTTVKTAVASRRQVVASETKGALYRRNRMAVATSLKRAARRPAAVYCGGVPD